MLFLTVMTFYELLQHMLKLGLEGTRLESCDDVETLREGCLLCHELTPLVHSRLIFLQQAFDLAARTWVEYAKIRSQDLQAIICK